MFFYHKNIKTEPNDCPHTVFPNLITDLSSTQYANEDVFFSRSTDSFLSGGHFVPKWFPIGSRDPVAVVVVFVVGEVSG